MKDWNNVPRAELLRCHLSTFVPLMIQEFLLRQRVLVMPRHDLAQVIAAHGDALLYRIPGQTARAVSALVEGLATMAFCPGGVTFMGLHFEVPPKEAIALLEEQDLAPSPPSLSTSKPVKAARAGLAGSWPTFEGRFRRKPGPPGGKRHGHC